MEPHEPLAPPLQRTAAAQLHRRALGGAASGSRPAWPPPWLARQDATSAEDRLTEQHRRSAREQEEDDNRARGEELARRVAQPRGGARDSVWLLGAPERPARGAVRDFARRTFVPERRVLVNFSPFAG